MKLSGINLHSFGIQPIMFKSFEVVHPVQQETLDLEFDFLHGHYSVEGAYLFEVCAIQDRIGSAPLQVTRVFCFFHSHNGDFFIKKS